MMITSGTVVYDIAIDRVLNRPYSIDVMRNFMKMLHARKRLVSPCNVHIPPLRPFVHIPFVKPVIQWVVTVMCNLDGSDEYIGDDSFEKRYLMNVASYNMSRMKDDAIYVGTVHDDDFVHHSFKREDGTYGVHTYPGYINVFDCGSEEFEIDIDEDDV